MAPRRPKEKARGASIRQGSNKAAWRHFQPMRRASPRGRRAKVKYHDRCENACRSYPSNAAWPVLFRESHVREHIPSASSMMAASFGTFGGSGRRRCATGVPPPRCILSKGRCDEGRDHRRPLFPAWGQGVSHEVDRGLLKNQSSAELCGSHRQPIPKLPLPEAMSG